MSKSMPIYYSIVESPLDALLLTSDGVALTGVHMAEYRDEPVRPAPGWLQRDELPVLAQARAELRTFFAGTRAAFSVPVRLAGTEFQRRVWAELTRIPYGTTISYGELARRIGQPSAVRAVGAANGRNPVAIIVPCHRVIGAGGALVGFGGGLDRKRILLALESGSTQQNLSINQQSLLQ